MALAATFSDLHIPSACSRVMKRCASSVGCDRPKPHRSLLRSDAARQATRRLPLPPHLPCAPGGGWSACLSFFGSSGLPARPSAPPAPRIARLRSSPLTSRGDAPHAAALSVSVLVRPVSGGLHRWSCVFGGRCVRVCVCVHTGVCACESADLLAAVWPFRCGKSLRPACTARFAWWRGVGLILVAA